MTRLFRQEVFGHKRAQRLGEPLVAPPLSFKLLTGFVTAVVIAIGCFLYWGTYTNKQTVAGYILPSKGLITVRAPHRGTVVARYVKLGDRVHEGQKLYRISLLRSTLKTADVNTALLKQYSAQLESIQAQIDAAKRLESAEISQLKSRQHDLTLEHKHLGKQLETANAILALARNNFSRYRKLADTGMVSKSDLQAVQQKMLTQQAAMEKLERDRIELQTELDQIPTELSQTSSGAASKIADLQNQFDQVKQQRLQLQVAQEIVVRAPAAGIVSSVLMKVGQSVSAQASLLSILPQGAVYEARLLVPTRAIGFVHSGQPVRLRYSAFPYQQFGLYRGQVQKVSRSIITPGELNLPVNLREPYYLVTASLSEPYVLAYGRRLPLTAGMTLSADIVLNRERLYEWVLRPIESLRGRL